MSRLAASLLSFVLAPAIVATPMHAIGQGYNNPANILISNIATFDAQIEKAELLVFVTPQAIRESSIAKEDLLEPTELPLYISCGTPSCAQLINLSIQGQSGIATVETDEYRNLIINNVIVALLNECCNDTQRLVVGIGKRCSADKVREAMDDPVAAKLPDVVITIVNKNGGTQAVSKKGRPLLIIAEDVEGEALATVPISGNN